jgi:hypothetical protein
MFVRIFEESAMAWEDKVSNERRERVDKGADREKLEALIEILFVVGFEGGGPGFKFGFERHLGRGGG